ncbi:glycerol-3-phosphate phosphatase-like protein [Hyaloscypha variabilis]|uniref:Glycerol-3-phosphate phosphatase-like protein n=1 Tax=Hyaloscypha variabilis (strain UAMH 11265 / GT02V1 / F) TaxID=1149755 RepID=A0A2J6SD97_HYAVF|nr:glycerol-3-phosphate phosphatase-like protein [Hyaloscypha variabilis F]
MGSHSGTYTSPPQRAVFKGLLFDFDGTLGDSTDAVVKHWHLIGKEIGVDPNVILQTSHGRRSIDVLKILSPEKANWEYIKHMEGLLPKNYGADVVEIPGARDLLDAVVTADVPWAIVTSGTTPLVTGWLDVLKLPIPEHLVVAEDVENGKPDPECYLMGKEKLGLSDKQGEVLVLEDSPAGIAAGKAAGCKVLAVVTSHTVEQVLAAKPDWIVKDLKSVKVVRHSGAGVELEILDALRMD